MNTFNEHSSAMNVLEQGAVVELSDGWYSIRASLDPPMSRLIRSRRIGVGDKLIMHGVEMVGNEDGCSPLEVRF